MTAEALQPRTFRDGREQLRAELSLLDLLMERHILRLRAAQLLNETDFRGLYIADEEVDALLRPAGRGIINAGAGELTARIDALRADLSSSAGEAFPLGSLQRRLALDRFEVELLVVAAACDIDLRYQTLFAYAQNDVTRKLPTVSLALQLLCDESEDRIDRRGSLDPDAPLIRESLVRVAADAQEDAPFLAHPLRADTRVVDFLLCRPDSVDRRLAACTRRAPPGRAPSGLALDAELSSRIANLLPHLSRGPSMIVVEGVDGGGRTAVAQAIAGQLGLPTLVFDASRLPSTLSADEALPLLRREALLAGDAVIVVGGDEALRARAARELLDFPRPLFLIAAGGSDAAPIALETGVPTYVIPVPLPSLAQRKRLWRDALGDDIDGMDAVAARFSLTPAQIRGAAAHARAAAASRPARHRAVRAEDLHAGAHAQSSRGLRRLAVRVEPRHDWSDLVLPQRPLQQLRDVCTSLEYRHVVHDDWGFGRRLPGSGTAVLFAGASGTGKTMAASIVARHLGLEMYRIDLAAVVSKYIGETEKNLERIFLEAQTSNAVLFFDEADALFGKRSEVKDAHDRYANIEVAYLLQRIESYGGIVILATNLGRNIDEAFARRMFDTIEFPYPDAFLREQIWLRMLRVGAPLSDDIDHHFLGRQFELSGGNIRNIVLTAAFSAAASSAPISMRTLILATARELQKIGRLPSRSEFRQFYEIVREGTTGPGESPIAEGPS